MSYTIDVKDVNIDCGESPECEKVLSLMIYFKTKNFKSRYFKQKSVCSFYKKYMREVKNFQNRIINLLAEMAEEGMIEYSLAGYFQDEFSKALKERDPFAVRKIYYSIRNLIPNLDY